MPFGRDEVRNMQDELRRPAAVNAQIATETKQRGHYVKFPSQMEDKVIIKNYKKFEKYIEFIEFCFLIKIFILLFPLSRIAV